MKSLSTKIWESARKEYPINVVIPYHRYMGSVSPEDFKAVCENDFMRISFKYGVGWLLTTKEDAALLQAMHEALV